VFTVLLHSNGKLLLPNYSGLQPSCHINPFLGLDFPEEPTSISPLLFLRGDIPVTSVIAFLKDTSMLYLIQRFCFQSRWSPDFVPCGLGIVLLSSNYSSPAPWLFSDRASFNVLLQPAVSSHHYRHFSWKLGQCSHLNLISPLESIPVRLFTSPGVLAAALWCLYHTKALLPPC
jgi:hypothetical protein